MKEYTNKITQDEVVMIKDAKYDKNKILIEFGEKDSWGWLEYNSIDICDAKMSIDMLLAQIS